MLDRLIDFAVRRRVATLIGALAFAIFGVLTFRHLKIEAFPDVTNVQVMVITLFPGQAAEEVEKRVTIPLERALTGTPRVLIQRSITSFGLSQVILTFEDDVDIYWARQQVAERLPDADMPDGITPRLGPNDTPVGQIYQYTLESDRHSPSELRSWQDWVVSKHLMRTPGVADVVSFGGFQKEYHVLADPGRLRNAGVTLDDLVSAVAGSNGATSGGYLRQGESEAVVRAQGYLRTPRDIRNTVIKATSGTPVLVRNVADVVEAYTPLRGAVARGGARDSIEGTILLRRGENPRDVLDGVHAGGRAHQPRHPAARHAHRALLRSHAAGRHDAGDGVAQHDRGRGAGQPGAVAVPARGQRLDRRRDHDAAGAADGVRRAALRRACPRTCCRWARSTSASCWTAPSSWSRTPTGGWPRSARRPRTSPAPWRTRRRRSCARRCSRCRSSPPR